MFFFLLFSHLLICQGMRAGTRDSEPGGINDLMVSEAMCMGAISQGDVSAEGKVARDENLELLTFKGV